MDIIVTFPSAPTRAAKNTTTTVPIVMVYAGDPVDTGLVASRARLGGSITGLSGLATDLSGKRLELLKAAVPGVTRVAYLWHSAPNTARTLQETGTAARALGVQLPPGEVRDPYPFDQAFATMAEAHADALITQPNPMFLDRRTEIVDLAARMQLPGISPERELAAAGGLMAYGSSIATNFRRAATYVAQTQQGCCWPTVLPSSRPSRCRARRRWIWPSREVAAAH